MTCSSFVSYDTFTSVSRKGVDARYYLMLRRVEESGKGTETCGSYFIAQKKYTYLTSHNRIVGLSDWV
jgi:hypothetical protein